MKRATRMAITHIGQDTKMQYHKLSGVLMLDPKELNGVRTDKLRAAFVLLDLAICEIDEVIGRKRSD